LLMFKQYLANPNSELYQNAFLPSWPNDFAADVKSGTLPSVSWLVSPMEYGPPWVRWRLSRFDVRGTGWSRLRAVCMNSTAL